MLPDDWRGYLERMIALLMKDVTRVGGGPTLNVSRWSVLSDILFEYLRHRLERLVLPRPDCSL